MRKSLPPPPPPPRVQQLSARLAPPTPPSKYHESKKILTLKLKSFSKVTPLSSPTSTVIPNKHCHPPCSMPAPAHTNQSPDPASVHK